MSGAGLPGGAVLLDGRALGGVPHGISRYAAELAAALPAADPGLALALLVGPGYPEPAPPGLTLARCAVPHLSLSEQWRLPRLLRRLRPALFHAPSFAVPRRLPVPLVLTLHDVNHLAFRREYTLFHALYYRLVVRRAALRARAVITGSEFSRQEIARRLRVPAALVSVIHYGVGGRFFSPPPAAVAELRRRHGLPPAFALYVGGGKVHKNVPGLVRAWRRLGERPPPLILALDSAEIKLEPEDRGRVRALGRVADEDLPALYAAAELFVFPSLYEGFGLPPLEALAAGTPVVASATGVLPEVLAGAAELVEPGDEEALAAAVRRLLAEPERRRRLAAAGRERVREMTWERAARRTAELYRRALAGE